MQTSLVNATFAGTTTINEIRVGKWLEVLSSSRDQNAKEEQSNYRI